ncbi:hypothetical protein ACI8AK_13990 [Geodermatophilus sp. SYSU D00867]
MSTTTSTTTSTSTTPRRTLRSWLRRFDAYTLQVFNAGTPARPGTR